MDHNKDDKNFHLLKNSRRRTINMCGKITSKFLAIIAGQTLNAKLVKLLFKTLNTVTER